MKLLMIIVLAVITIISCSDEPDIINITLKEETEITNKRPLIEQLDISVKKWYNNKTAAISLTYDIAIDADSISKIAGDLAIDSGIKLEYEFVSDRYDDGDRDSIVNKMINYWIPNGVTFFGHGHKHLNHDTLSYEVTYDSFKKCFNFMQSRGLNSKIYCYPGGAGFEYETQVACERAGYIAARGSSHGYNENPEEFYHFPDSIKEPLDWFLMKSIPMGKGHDDIVNNNEELITVLKNAENKTSYVILLYHNIGYDSGWHFYELEEFKKDISSIKKRNFWIASMEEVIKYAIERKEFNYYISKSLSENWMYEISFIDNLDNKIYNQELTIELRLNDEMADEYDYLVYMDPSTNDIKWLKIKDGFVEMNVLPNEKFYKINFMKEGKTNE